MADDLTPTLSLAFDVDDGPDPDQDAFDTATLKLKDGGVIEFRRLQGIDDDGWEQVKKYLENNPTISRVLKRHEGSPAVVLSWLKTQALVEHAGGGRSAGNGHSVKALTQRAKALESDPEARIRAAMEGIRRGGIVKAMEVCSDDAFISLVSKRMGGVPEELGPYLKEVENTQVSFHQACKTGDLLLVKTYLAANNSVDSRDHFGITPIGYAIGSGHFNIVNSLMGARANVVGVDCMGNTGLHYAAGYGHPEILQHLLETSSNSINVENNKGETPLDVATMNRQVLTMETLHLHGAVCRATPQKDAMLATSIANIHPGVLGMSAVSAVCVERDDMS